MHTRCIVLCVLLVLSVSVFSAAETGLKVGFLYIGDYDFDSADGEALRDDADGTIFAIEQYHCLVPYLYLNYELAYSKNDEAVTFNDEVDAVMESTIIPLSVNLVLMLGPEFLKVYGGAGIGAYYIKNRLAIDTPGIDFSGSEYELYWGYQLKAGVKWYVSENFALYGEYQYRRFGDETEFTLDSETYKHDGDTILGQLSVGMAFSF